MTAAHQLRPDEVQCQWCRNIFLSPEAYEAHKPRAKGCWLGMTTGNTNGLELNKTTARWHFSGKDPSKRPRKTPAQAAFERLMEELARHRALKSFQIDIDKVNAALTRDRDR